MSECVCVPQKREIRNVLKAFTVQLYIVTTHTHTHTHTFSFYERNMFYVNHDDGNRMRVY